MKKNITLILLSSSLLLSCSMGGFKPPKQYYIWLPGEQFFSSARERNEKFDSIAQRRTDMLACGMDIVRGESGKLKVNLCMEQKGWYLLQGPVCEEKYVWDEPECIEWRKKHSKPDAEPWE